jgi:predicted transcriptional regulator
MSYEIDSQEDYEFDIVIPNLGDSREIEVFGDTGGLAIDLDVERSSFIISTEKSYNIYSLKLTSEGDFGREVFEVTDINLTGSEVHHYSVNNWEGFIQDPKAVTLGVDNNGDETIDLIIDLENGMTGEEIQVIIMNKGKSDSSFITITSIMLIVGFVSIASIGGLIASTEVGKLALISLILPLYTRIKKEKVLDNEIRGMIRGYIIANPGDNYNSIKRALDLNNGTLAYHLRVLERTKIIRSKQDGMYKRFYPAGMKVPAENGGEISEIQRILLKKIAESPGISQKEIAKMLGLSKGVINYHVKILYGKHLLKMERRGRKTLCYADKKMIKNNS